MAVAKSVYEKIMAATTLAEYAAAKVVDPMYQSSIDALLAEYVATLTADEQAAYAAKIAELEALVPPVLSFETVEEIYAAILAAETKADYDAILAAISDEQKAELDAYVLTLTEEEQAAYATHIEALMEEPADLFAGMEELYLSLLAAETLDDYDAIMDGMSEEQSAIFGLYINAERAAALNAKRSELVEAALRETAPGPAVNFDNVAPIDTTPLEAPAPMARAMSLMSVYRAAPQRANDNNPDGLEMSKTISEDPDGGYTITLESYVTGNITVSGGKPVPTDIVLVIDQSGSMADGIAGVGSYESYYAQSPEGLYNAVNGSGWYHQTIYVEADGEYYELKAEAIQEWTTTYTSVNEAYEDYWGGHKDPTNSDMYSDRERLHYRADDGTYQKVSVERHGNFFSGYDYTYTVNGEEIAYSEKANGAPNQDVLGRLFLSSSSEATTGYTFSYTTADGQTVQVDTGLDDLDEVANWKLYTYQEGEEEPRLDALVRAADAFVDNVKQNAEKNNVDHRIAVVGFSSSGYDNTELLTGVTVKAEKPDYDHNTSYYPNDTAYNGVQYGEITNEQYASALEDMSTVDGQNDVYAAIDALTAHGGTQTNHGLDMAQKIFSNDTKKNEGRNRVVIVFTDGEPGSNGFDSRVANNAINYAGKLKNDKDGNVTVYTIGIFDGADGTPPVDNRTSNANTFMHYVSSNYPNASDMDNGGRLNPNLDGDSYYLSASDSGTLSSIFEQISDEIQDGGSSVTLNAQAVVQDVIADQFQLPEGTTANDIKVYTQNATDNALNNPSASSSWEARQAFTGAQITVDEETGTVSVSNFDFARNFVADTGRAEGDVSQSGSFYGRKLVIEIPIEVRDGFFGGNNIDTNAEGSGIFADSHAVDPTGTFVSPNLNVPVKYQIDAKDQSIYLTQNGDGKDLIVYVETGDDGVFYVPNGWNNSHVTITYTVKEGDKIIGTYTIQPRHTGGSWEWEPGYDDGVLSNLTDCTKYNISCTVTPNSGVEDSVSAPAVTEREVDNVEATVHVFKPSVSFGDQSTYLTVEPGENTYQVTWADTDETGHSPAQPAGDPPALTITSEAAADADKTKDYVKTVTATVKGYTGTINVQENTTFVRTPCEDDDALSNTNEFYVHVFKPEIKWTDSKEDYGTKLTDEFLKGHQVGEVTWTHTNSANVPALSGTAPELTYSFASADGETLTTLQAETNVKVTVKVGDTNITEDTTFSWQKGKDCPDTCTDPNKLTPAYQFRIHLNNFDLTVTKRVTDNKTYDADDNFLFTLYQDDDVYATFTLQAGKSVTFKNLQAGHTYTVVEDTDWSWRYTCTDGATKTVGTISDGKAELTFTNTLKEDIGEKWLSDEGRLINDFKGPTGSATKLNSDAMITPAYRMDTKDDEDEERS